MRVVLDTNVLARVVASREGPAGELFDRLQSGHLLIASPPILTELARVLTYERVRRLHRLNDGQIVQFLERIESGSLVVGLSKDVPCVVPHDRDDDYVVATAVASRANVLCTRNRHLFHREVVAYCGQRSIRVMDDLELLRRMRELEE